MAEEPELPIVVAAVEEPYSSLELTVGPYLGRGPAAEQRAAAVVVVAAEWQEEVVPRTPPVQVLVGAAAEEL